MSRAKGTLTSLLIVAAACGCGDDQVALPDAGDTASRPDAGVEATPPVAPALPSLLPCPPGWRAIVTDEDVMACDPWPSTGREECTAPDEAHFAGEPGCARVGSACPAGELPEGLPTDRTIVYVSGAAAAGGDGSLAAPFTRITDAIVTAAPGSIVAIGKGTYDEPLAIPANLTLWGACVRDTILRSSTPSPTNNGVTQPNGMGVILRNLRIGASARPAVVSRAASRVIQLEDVIIEHAARVGVVATGGGRVVVRGSVVRDTDLTAGLRGRAFEIYTGSSADLDRVVLERNGDGVLALLGAVATLTAHALVLRDSRGIGLALQDGAGATVDASVLEDNTGLAVSVAGGSVARLESSVVRNTRALSDGTGGYGAQVGTDGTLELVRLLIERNVRAGLVATSGGGARIENSVVRDTMHLSGEPMWPRAVHAQAGGRIELAAVLIARSTGIALGASSEGTTMLAEDVTVIDSLAVEETGRGGVALEVDTGAIAEVHRARFERNRDVAILASDASSSLTMEDVIVRDTAARGDGTWGRALNVQAGADVGVRRALFERNREYSIQAAASTLRLENVVVRDSLDRPADGRAGAALVGQGGAIVEVVRSVLERSHQSGVTADGAGTSVRLDHVVVRDSLGEGGPGEHGRGLSAQNGAHIDAMRSRIERTREVGVFAAGAGTQMTLSDVDITDIAPRACEPTTCADRTGHGIVANLAALVRATRFTVRGAALCGVQLAGGAEMDLETGEITGCEIGVCLQVASYDVGRLSSGVMLRDNTRNLDSTTLPVPGALTGLDGM